MRESAASALGALGNVRALPALQRRQQHDTGEYLGRNVRDAATKAIARIARLLNDKDADVHERAAGALNDRAREPVSE